MTWERFERGEEAGFYVSLYRSDCREHQDYISGGIWFKPQPSTAIFAVGGGFVVSFASKVHM
jgi:hypothetical protein